MFYLAVTLPLPRDHHNVISSFFVIYVINQSLVKFTSLTSGTSGRQAFGDIDNGRRMDDSKSNSSVDREMSQLN